MKKIVYYSFLILLASSCVSKQEFLALQDENSEIKSELAQSRVQLEDEQQKNKLLLAKVGMVQSRVDAYYNKINSLTEDNNLKLETVDGNSAVINEVTKRKMRRTLQKVDPALVARARTLHDSMNLAVSYTLRKSMASQNFMEDDDLNINIDETIVMISLSDKMLFKTGSTTLNNASDAVLRKIANVIKSEPSISVYVEGHTDPRSIHNSRMQDNWDLSVLRATSVVRKFQKELGVPPEQLIAAGRSSYHPIAPNDTKDNQAKNRRTRIALLPDINKFFALMAD